MPAIKGAREELERLKRELAEIDAGSQPADVKAAKRRDALEQQIDRLETAIRDYGG